MHPGLFMRNIHCSQEKECFLQNSSSLFYVLQLQGKGKDHSAARLPRCQPVLVHTEKLIASLWYTQTGAVSCMDCLPSQTLFLHGLEPCHFHLTKPVSALAVTRPSSLMPESVTTLPEQHVLLAALGMLPNIQLHIMVCHLTIGTSGYKQANRNLLCSQKSPLIWGKSNNI